MIVFEEIEGIPGKEILERIKAFYQSIFAKTDLEKFSRRINSAEKLLIIIAVSGDEIIGFKIGYQISPSTFYSWVGGVREDYRQQGIGAEMMKRQHLWSQKNGFRKVRTKTKNHFRAMLILNIKNGFDVTETYLDKLGETKIILEKSL